MPPFDPTNGAAPGMNGPYRGGFPIVPSDVTPVPILPRRIWVGSGGDLSVAMRSGDIITLKNIPPGTPMDLIVTHVLSTNTTASNLVGLY